MVAQKEDEWQLTMLFTKIGRIKFYVLMLVVIGFVSVGKAFMVLWGGPEYVESYYIALLLIIPAVVPLSQSLGIEIQRAKNMHQTRSVVYFFIAIGNVLLSIPLIQLYGGIGAALGTAIALFLGNVLFMNWYYHKRIGLNMIYFWKEIISIFPSLLAPLAIGLVVKHYAIITGWLQLLFYCVVIACVYLVSVFRLGFNAYEKELVYAVIRRLPKLKAK
jgi:O-antigen/teichoic acid export membrane protein